jgi:hypothetical protein
LLVLGEMLSPPGHDALHQSGNERKDCTADTAHDNLRENCPDIESISRAEKSWHQNLKRLTSAHAVTMPQL